MTYAIAAFADLVSELDPGRDADTITVNVTDCPDPDRARDHLHLCNISYQLHPSESMRVVTVGELRSLRLSNDRHDGEPVLLDAILSAMTDSDHAELLGGLRHLRRMQPRENDCARIMSDIDTIEALAQLTHEYVEYEDNIYEELAQNGSFSQDHARLQLETRRIFADLDHVRRHTVASEKARRVVLDAAVQTHAIVVDETPVRVALGETPGDVDAAEDPTTTRHWVTPLWYALGGSSEDYYRRNLTTLPRWAVDLLRVIAPDVVHSNPYPLDSTPADLLETAEALWRDGGAFAEFDIAMKAAVTLLAD